ncbi:MAG: type II toxin-antitoxin system HicA family toxin [Parcubacteria group bacterium]|nr:type II toxin-antitoxin system HicA family toxin [Parcubacteria group bacterium]
MPDKLPRLTAKQIITILERLGFVFSRASGSHRIYKHPDGKRTTVPFHGKKILHPKILKYILRDASCTIETLENLL